MVGVNTHTNLPVETAAYKIQPGELVNSLPTHFHGCGNRPPHIDQSNFRHMGDAARLEAFLSASAGISTGASQSAMPAPGTPSTRTALPHGCKQQHMHSDSDSHNHRHNHGVPSNARLPNYQPLSYQYHTNIANANNPNTSNPPNHNQNRNLSTDQRPQRHEHTEDNNSNSNDSDPNNSSTHLKAPNHSSQALHPPLTPEASNQKFLASMLLQRDMAPTLLPLHYAPRPQDICCGRGKYSWRHPGNAAFRNMIQTTIDKYRTAKTKYDKTSVVVATVERLRSEGVLMVRKASKKEEFEFAMESPNQERELDIVMRRYNAASPLPPPRYLEIGNAQARDKVGHAFRDIVREKQGKEKEKKISSSNNDDDNNNKIPTKIELKNKSVGSRLKDNIRRASSSSNTSDVTNSTANTTHTNVTRSSNSTIRTNHTDYDDYYHDTSKSTGCDMTYFSGEGRNGAGNDLPLANNKNNNTDTARQRELSHDSIQSQRELQAQGRYNVCVASSPELPPYPYNSKNNPQSTTTRTATGMDHSPRPRSPEWQPWQAEVDGEEEEANETTQEPPLPAVYRQATVPNWFQEAHQDRQNPQAVANRYQYLPPLHHRQQQQLQHHEHCVTATSQQRKQQRQMLTLSSRQHKQRRKYKVAMASPFSVMAPSTSSPTYDNDTIGGGIRRRRSTRGSSSSRPASDEDEPFVSTAEAAAALMMQIRDQELQNNVPDASTTTTTAAPKDEQDYYKICVVADHHYANPYGGQKPSKEEEEDAHQEPSLPRQRPAFGAMVPQQTKQKSLHHHHDDGRTGGAKGNIVAATFAPPPAMKRARPVTSSMMRRQEFQKQWSEPMTSGVDQGLGTTVVTLDAIWGTTASGSRTKQRPKNHNDDDDDDEDEEEWRDGANAPPPGRLGTVSLSRSAGITFEEEGRVNGYKKARNEARWLREQTLVLPDTILSQHGKTTQS